MKKTVFQIAVAVMLLMMGCSKDELIDEASENNQLKKGRVYRAIEFYSTSSGTESWPLTLTENFEGKILKNGNFSGSFGMYGKIDSELSEYNFAEPGIVPNPDYYRITPNYQLCINDYLLDFVGASATIYVVPKGKPSTDRDYFTIEFTTGHNPYINLWTEKWGPGSKYGEVYFAGVFNGTVIVKSASENLSTIVDRKFWVSRIDMYGINLTTGQIDLAFREIIQ